MTEQMKEKNISLKSETAYSDHKHRLYSYGLYMTGNQQLAEDIVQDVFVKYLEHKSEFDTPHHLANWLFICARNLIFNRLEKEKRTITYDFSAMAVEPKIELKLFIENILQKLKQNEKDLILLREQQGFSIRELSAMLELSEETIRVRLFRIRKKIVDMKASLL